MDRDYGHTSYGRSMDSFAVDNSSDRYGPYESFDSRSAVSGRDLYRSGYGYNESNQGYGDSYDGRYENPYRSSVDSYDGRNQGGSSWDPSFTRTKVRTGFMEDRGRDTYSSYGAFSSPYMKPATVGSRGRGMPAYPDGAFGGRSNDAFGGPAAGRGRGRGGQLGRGMRRSAMFDYKKQPMAGGMARGIKRKMGQPFKSPVGLGKKQKVNKAGGNQNAKNTPAPEPVDPEEEEKRRTEARREKQRRRREKNSEKYGDGHCLDRLDEIISESTGGKSILLPQNKPKRPPPRRDSGPRFQNLRRSTVSRYQARICARMAFTCSFCKFRSFDEKGIEEHLENQAHQDMLDHIQKQTKFDKPVMEFLHECIVNKYKKTAARKAQSVQNEAAKAPEKDIMEGVTPDDHMMKVETVHCSACSVYVPALHSSVQLHLKSADHSKSKLGYKDQIKRESILTATSILNNPLVKARYELYLKGENPFEAHPEETAVGSVAEDATEVPPAAESSDAAGATASEDFTADCLASSEGN